MVEGLVGDRYHLVREIGRGGMGVVYLGRDLRRDMDVAIKFRGVTHGEATLWLKREFRAVSSLRHPNLVELYELVAHDQACYFTMEYLPGIDPRRFVERGDHALPPMHADPTTLAAVPLQEAHTEVSGGRAVLGSPEHAVPRTLHAVEMPRVRSVLAQLAEGLAYLHARGVIHRDVKPSNAIVVDGAVKLLDFGLALEPSRKREQAEARVVGTAAYLAPEYLERLHVTPAIDVYALGVLGFELVTGAPPFGGTLHLLQRLGRKITAPRPSTINGEVPPDLDTLIIRMLDPEPERRPNALEVAIALTGSSTQSRAARRTHRFVGRAHELARLEAAIRDPEPRGRFTLVTGPSGSGKTALIDEAVSRAASHDTLIWRSRCDERERVPYRAFDLIIDDLATELAGDPTLVEEIEHVAALVRVFPVLAPLVDAELLAAPPAGDLRVERERALDAMTQLFAQLLRGRTGPTSAIISIDDLQWADHDSLELLGLLVERVPRALTVIASWTVEDGALPELVIALLERLGARAQTIALQAMPDDEIARVIAELAPRIPFDRRAEAARLAAGSPYLAELIGHELAEANIASAIDDAEARRLARLDADERALAELAAVANGAATFEELRAISELPAGKLHSLLRGLEDARVLRAMPSAAGDVVHVFYHQRLREAAYAALAPEPRRARHAQFASWFDGIGGEPAQLAFHHEHAGHRAEAAHWSVVAGDAARAQLAWNLAIDHYRRALALAPGPDLRVRAAYADCLFLSGKLAAAAEELLALADDLPEPDADRCRVRASEAYIKLAEIDRGIAILDDVLERRGEKRPRTRALSIMRAASVGARWLSPHRATPHQPVDDVLASAYRVIACFLSTPYPIEALEYVVRGIALAERTGDDAARAQGMAMLAAYLAAGSLGRFGDRAIASAERLAAQSGAPYPKMVTAGCTGILAMLRGDWTGMRVAHESGRRICERLGLERSWEASFLRSYWALGEYYAGEPATALAMLDELMSATSGADDLFSRAMIGSYRGRALVMANELAAARGLVRELERTPAARHGMAAIYHHVFAAELALGEHDWQRASAIAGQLAASARAQWLHAMPAISAMIDVISATADIGLREPERALATAQRIYRRGRASHYAVTALRLWGQAEEVRGRRSKARSLYDRARTEASRRGGKLDRLALAALAGARVDAGPLAPAIAWSTGGIVRG